MSEFSIREAGMTSTGQPQAGKQKSAELRRATGTVEHHSANARAMAISSPETLVAE
jgi:hypothetical protein